MDVATPTRRSALFDLDRTPAAPALVAAGEVVTYGVLADLVARRQDQLGTTRRLVVLEAAPEIDFVATYLACLGGGHPVLLAPPGAIGTRSWSELVERFDPDVVVRRDSGWTLEERRPGSRHELHPDLCLLLSTSGSTGSPRLVRLSHENVTSNAAAIADLLGLRPEDRATTSLPLHYCYGLSQLHSHLEVGASVWLTELSVADPDFFPELERAGATSVAGVPHTFDLLEQRGIPERLPPRLRYLTVAGGALAADRVRELARLGQRQGFDLHVMYGQTEATARMASLAPELAAERAGTVGLPIAGGSLRIEDGELIYSGPNVMLGYAEQPADLAAGRTVTELRTGDRAVQHADGLFEIMGRSARTAKLFGVRLELDRVEQLLADQGLRAWATATDDRLVVGVRTADAGHPALGVLTEELCLPTFAVSQVAVEQVPLTASGKPDYRALRDLAERRPEPQARDVAGLYAWLLGRPDCGPDDSFVSLGGDSLSFVEVSVHLEALLGRLPADWPSATVAELDALVARRSGPVRRRRTRFIEVPVALRAAAIVAVVGSHTEWFAAPGGAHILLAVLGFNLARFQLSTPDRGERVRRLLGSAVGLAVPCMLWIGALVVLTGRYDWSTALLLNDALGEQRWSVDWQFWFVEAAVWSAFALAALMAVPAVHRLDRARPWECALAATLVALGYRWIVAAPTAGAVERYSVAAVAWCVLLGVLAARADTGARRVLVSLLTVVGVAGFFGDPTREATVAAGVLALVWIRGVRVPTALVAPIGLLASASLWIYLTHWVVYPPLDDDHDVLAALLSLGVGIVTFLVVRWLGQRFSALTAPTGAGLAGRA